MKIDWSKLNKIYFILWYLVTIPLFLLIGYLLNWHIIVSLVTGHLMWFINMAFSLAKYITENREDV